MRYKVLWGGRGAGRSWGIARALLLLGTMRSIRVLCVRELQKSIEDSVHKVLSDQIDNLGLGGFYDIQKAKIIGANGTTFSFEGIKNNVNAIKSYEGIDYCWAEEANKISKNSWSVLIPTIRKDNSEIWISFNPELDTDYTYIRFVKKFDEHNTVSVKMTYKDNPWFPETLRDEMENEKKRDYDNYLNVWEGFTRQNLEGAVYAKELRKCQEESRICSVPYDREIPVDCFWDLGRADNTAIWFGQRVAMQWRVLAYYENSGEDITHFLKELQRRNYLYGTMWLPHDARAKRLGTKHSIEEIIRNAYPNTRIVPNLSIEDGINAARELLLSCFFDEDNCEDGLHALRHYQFKVIDGQLSNKPLHNQYSDGADAFRYMAIARRNPGGKRETSVISKLRRAVNKFADTAPNLGWMQ